MIQNAEYGVRANVILPGLMDTPMAVDTRAAVSKPRAEIARHATQKCRFGARWVRRWTSLMQRCISPGMRPRS